MNVRELIAARTKAMDIIADRCPISGYCVCFADEYSFIRCGHLGGYSTDKTGHFVVRCKCPIEDC